MSEAKTKGTRYETAIVNMFNDWYGLKIAERIALHGDKDNGDIRLKVDDLIVCVEAKWNKSYPNEKKMLDFREQTVKETNNSGADCGILVVNHYNQSIMRSEVWMTGSTWLMLNGYDNSTRIGKYDVHDWLCMTMLDFCWTCFGAPAWGMEELN